MKWLNVSLETNESRNESELLIKYIQLYPQQIQSSENLHVNGFTSKDSGVGTTQRKETERQKEEFD